MTHPRLRTDSTSRECDFRYLVCTGPERELPGHRVRRWRTPRAPTAPSENCEPGACSGTYYGADLSAMTQATSRWPQIDRTGAGSPTSRRSRNTTGGNTVGCGIKEPTRRPPLSTP